MANLQFLLKILSMHLPKLLNSLMEFISKTQSSIPASQQSVTEKPLSNLPYKHLVESETAKRLGIDNSPNDEQVSNLQKLNIEIYMPIELDLRKDGIELKATSGFRSSQLNIAVNGAKNSDHMEGNAVDLTAPPLTPTELYQRIKKLQLHYKQLIIEPSWVHVSREPQPSRCQDLQAYYEGKILKYRNI